MTITIIVFGIIIALGAIYATIETICIIRRTSKLEMELARIHRSRPSPTPDAPPPPPPPPPRREGPTRPRPPAPIGTGQLPEIRAQWPREVLAEYVPPTMRAEYVKDAAIDAMSTYATTIKKKEKKPQRNLNLRKL